MLIVFKGLIWSGLDAAGGAGVHGLHLCQYQDEDHLCFWQGEQKGIHGSGLGVIMNNHYEIVKTVQSVGAMSSADFHEFRLTQTNSALLTVYRPQFSKSRWLLDSCFQEVDLTDGHLIFEWCAVDHIHTDESRVPFDSYEMVGDAETKETAWDFVHLNSVDKFAGGDYLVSARHMDAILRISHVDGSIVWRLNGDRSNFLMREVCFHRQHDARLIEENNSSLLITVFNNDGDGVTRKGYPSSGLILRVDLENETAEEVAKFRNPVEALAESDKMGNVLTLPGDHIFMGFGENSTMSEFSPDGTLLWTAGFGSGSSNYRAFKSHWTGEPVQPPALWTYSKSNQSPMTFYASWNGATDVLGWRFYASDKKDGGYELVGTADKVGFETNYTLTQSRPWGFVEAYGRYGSLKNSSKVKTYLPESRIADDCGIFHCFPDPSPKPITTLPDPVPSVNEPEPISVSPPPQTHTDVFLYVEHLLAIAGLVFFLWHGWKFIRKPRTYSWKYSQIRKDEEETIMV